MTRRLAVDGVPYHVSSVASNTHREGRFQATVVTVTGPSMPASSVEVRVLDATTREVSAPDGAWRRLVHTVYDGDRHWVFSGGHVFEIQATEPSHRPSAPPTSGTLEAPMPATVASVLVRAGQTVRQGETLLVLEAMKMELPLRAPEDGVVSVVHCQPGDLVQPGGALVDLVRPGGALVDVGDPPV